MNSKLENDLIEKIEKKLKPYLKNFYEVDPIFFMNSSMKVKAQENEDKLSRMLILAVTVFHDYKEVQIPNIYMPEFMRYQGIGKKLISIIFDVCQNHNYNLFVVDMVPSFYNKLITREALVLDDDSVQITSKTILD